MTANNASNDVWIKVKDCIDSKNCVDDCSICSCVKGSDKLISANALKKTLSGTSSLHGLLLQLIDDQPPVKAIPIQVIQDMITTLQNPDPLGTEDFRSGYESRNNEVLKIIRKFCGIPEEEDDGQTN